MSPQIAITPNNQLSYWKNVTLMTSVKNFISSTQTFVKIGFKHTILVINLSVPVNQIA